MCSTNKNMLFANRNFSHYRTTMKITRRKTKRGGRLCQPRKGFWIKSWTAWSNSYMSLSNYNKQSRLRMSGVTRFRSAEPLEIPRPATGGSSSSQTGISEGSPPNTSLKMCSVQCYGFTRRTLLSSRSERELLKNAIVSPTSTLVQSAIMCIST